MSSLLIVTMLLLFGFSHQSPPKALPSDNINDGNLHPCDKVPGNYSTWLSTAQSVGVAIVGGGVAGLNAAKSFIANNFTDFLILEAEDYLGGRVKTYREGDILVEDGAEWIHGGVKNPLYRFAKRMKAVTAPMTTAESDWKVVTQDGRTSDPSKYPMIEQMMGVCMSEAVVKHYVNTSYGQCYMDRYPSFYGSGSSTKLGKAWLHLLEQIVNYEEGTDSWFNSSAKDTGRYANYGANYQFKDGYDAIVNHLKASIPSDAVKLSTPVCRINWNHPSKNQVLVVTRGGVETFLADRVIVTTSIGYLKDSHEQLFQPALPQPLLEDLTGIELGVADKVQMGWSDRWWGQKPMWILILWTEFNLPPEKEWMYGIVQVKSVHQMNSVVQVFVTGHHARAMESLPEEVVKQHFQELLTNVTNMDVPKPTFFRRSQWGSNPWTRGAYSSYVTVEGEKAGLHSRNPFQASLTNSLGKKAVIWAGEHTHNIHYSTVDGAMASGKRATSEVLEEMEIIAQEINSL